MRFLVLFAIVVSAVRQSLAFPPSYFEGHARGIPNLTLPIFSSDQRIDVEANPFLAPGKNDHRGPCPGLNALANHQFIPHNGIVTFTAAILQSNRVFGLGLDTAAIAAVLALFGADLLGVDFPFSIGGGGDLGLLRAPTGLSGTHNQFESDSSVTRGDFYQFDGDNYHLQLRYFEALYNLQPDSPDSNYDAETIFEHSHIRFHQSIAEDEFFFYGPLQMFVSCLTHNLVYGLMSNHSAESPEGFLQGEVLKSIYAISTDLSGNLVYTPGHERIPENWYRRPFLDEYDARHVIPDLLAMWLRYPELLLFGGNINGTNTYAPIDIGNLTGGVFNTASLLEGDNAACFVFQALQILVPDALSGLAGVVGVIVSKLLDVLGPLLAGLTCPKLTTMNREILEQYPGYRQSSHPV
ncbi:hypothetical protein C8F04DRAFT_1303402 [Mycena alexandri]|uniref:Heme haloperoxidase family profile domain-containing protein n=1 Tax=Mycena alexandri TaxID=1745969 RepID=A0AAD6SAD4_9AGAR|nr:hypothetical protein C8F04DRAFT_1303402 [Mycena alexandri]